MDGSVVTIILGGGRGTRLQPLTSVRAKPAVPLAGKYRLIDIPVSNSINSGYRRIYVLTQFNSASLHRHISLAYQFDRFSRGRIEVLAAEQTVESGDWFQGTADAVRKHWHRFDRPGVDHLLILSGDHLYRMDYRKLVRRHVDSGADATISFCSVDRESCGGLGIAAVDERGFVTRFLEKPNQSVDLGDYAVPAALRDGWGTSPARPFLASMGVYVFRREVLRDALAQDLGHDFGRHILPALVPSGRIAAYAFGGYWEDIGTVEAFFRANLALCAEVPSFTFWHHEAPIYTRPRVLPAARLDDCTIKQSIVADGCMVQGATLDRCVVGMRSIIRRGVVAKDSVIMGADFHEEDGEAAADGHLPVGIGEDCHLERVIVDKDARVGRGCRLVGRADRPDAQGHGWAVRDGIVVVMKKAVIPDGTVI
jgi:glucose-1-phosphate adenylyltransferase